MAKTRNTKQEKQSEALEKLRQWSFATGMTIIASDLKHRLQWLAEWLDNCPTEVEYDLIYHERLALYNGYYASACKRGLISEVK
jgi:hypothetical protein